MPSTKISITEGVSAIDSMMLNIAELEKNTEYTKIAYCSKVESGITQEGKQFFKFNLLDKNGKLIIARLFNIEKVDSKGTVANNLASSVVKINFSVSLFSGVESLTLYGIDKIQEDVLSREEFIGELPNILDDLEYVKKVSTHVCSKYSLIGSLITKYSLMDGIETVTMPDMWAERRGGALKFTSHFLKMISSVCSPDEYDEVLTIVLLSELFMYWKYAANYEEDILSLGDNINDILAKSDKYLDAVIKVAKERDAKVEFNICKEAKHLIKCYFGYDKPTTYKSMFLYSMRNSLQKKFKLQEEDSVMLHGTYKNVLCDGDKLVRIVKL